MWFEIFLNFITSLLPQIQETALDIMEFLTFEITLPTVDMGFIIIQETTFSVGEVLFGSSLTLALTLSIWIFILKLIPTA